MARRCRIKVGPKKGRFKKCKTGGRKRKRNRLDGPNLKRGRKGTRTRTRRRVCRTQKGHFKRCTTTTTKRRKRRKNRLDGVSGGA